MSTNNASLSAHPSTFWPDGGRQVRQPASYWQDRIDCPKGCGKFLHRNHMPQHVERCNGPHVEAIPADHERCGVNGCNNPKRIHAHSCYQCSERDPRMDELDRLTKSGKYKVAGEAKADDTPPKLQYRATPAMKTKWLQRRSDWLLANGKTEQWEREFGTQK